MGEGKRQMAQSPCSPYVGHGKDHDHDQWTIIDGEDDDHTYKMNATSPSSSTTSSSLGGSTVSNGSSLSSSEMVDDATSSSNNNSSSSSLDDLSDLMAQLPIK
ncbi:hypothetical protein RHGRI_035336 [Rhododendron griersonianum]|uniref:Uncharacterized protein n=1 Tax=Rhododendron griersonianum TaxID=479676 RepID=A0AAV6I6T5_9ERIC|nr:hypothetical protein RHGRI_035336 [Rhododendron griersonianum]